MTNNIQIKCIKKNDRTSAHERISHIGGINPSGNRWKLTLDEAIRDIENGKWKMEILCKRKWRVSLGHCLN